jgi:hypothetical protein
MSDEKSLINLGDISKPVTILIKKVSDAVGVLYEPSKVVKIAKAEAEAEKIKALASIELTEIQERAMARLVHQEARKQENIEAITSQAAASLSDNANVEDLEEDWVAHLFKQCDTVSDEEMQSIWSKLLSGEANKPGTYSKRTVDFVASMDKKDADLFTKFCQFCCFLGRVMPFIMKADDDVYTSKGLGFVALKHLDSIGLISFESTSGYRQLSLAKYVQIYYFGTPILMEFNKDNDNELNIGKVMLTQAGQELSQVCGAERNEDFYNYLVKSLFEAGLILSTPLPKK